MSAHAHSPHIQHITQHTTHNTTNTRTHAPRIHAYTHTRHISHHIATARNRATTDLHSSDVALKEVVQLHDDIVSLVPVQLHAIVAFIAVVTLTQTVSVMLTVGGSGVGVRG